MQKISYSAKILFESEIDKNKLLLLLEAHKFTLNECFKVKFNEVKENSIVHLHNKFYKNFRKVYSNIPSNIVIRAEQECLSSFRAIKRNHHKIHEPPSKGRLSLRLDNHLYVYKQNKIFRFSTLEKRIQCTFQSYEKLDWLLDKYTFGDPLLFERDGEIFISLTFNIPEIPCQQKLATGIDLGIKNFAATSEGNLYRDKKFNKQKRSLRYLKRQLQSASAKGSKTAKKHLRKLKHKERNINKNFSHHLANKLIKESKGDVLVLENLKSLKVKKHKYQNNNKISQVPFFELRKILTYKAPMFGKTVILVCPSYTSQIDHRTEEKDGIRKGSRYIGSDKQLLHADINAAINIAKRSKLPCSISNYFAWQAVVNQPIVNAVCSQTY